VMRMKTTMIDRISSTKKPAAKSITKVVCSLTSINPILAVGLVGMKAYTLYEAI
jgi:nitrate reductase NapE component